MKDENCIFCAIVSGNVPAYVVYEDSTFLAFLDHNPRSPGHTLIIPKEHYRWVWDVPEIGTYFEVTRDIARAQQRAFHVDMIRSQVYGEEVPHAHIWVWPDDAPGDPTDFEKHMEHIKEALG